MTLGLDLVGLVVTTVGFGAASLRWLRVCQREHYLAGSVLRFARRWWLSDTAGTVLLLIGLGGVALVELAPQSVIATGAVTALAPLGLGVRGRTAKLVWTRRLRLLGGLVVLIAAIGVGIGASFGLDGALLGTGLAALLSPLLVEIAVRLASPLEEHLAKRHVKDASAVLARVRPIVVGITGSYGKTSTKTYVAHLVSGRFSVLASPRSYNNRAGLSRTVNELLSPGVEVLVAEMGAYGPGEIAALCSWLHPEVAVITAIGPMHLERFGSLEATLRAKSEITSTARVVVLNLDDPLLCPLAARLSLEGREVVSCSARAREAMVLLEATELGAALSVKGERVGEARFGLGSAPGFLTNAACALGAALALGCEPTELLERLGRLPQPENRLEPLRTETGLLVLDDTYNANPVGARHALETLAKAGDGHRVVVTPGLIELGHEQEGENASFAEAAGCSGAEVVIVGRTNKKALLAGVRRAGTSAVTVKGRDEAVAFVRANLGQGDAVLYENDLPDHYP